MCFQKVTILNIFEKIKFENILKVAGKYKKINKLKIVTFLKSVKYFKINYKIQNLKSATCDFIKNRMKNYLKNNIASRTYRKLKSVKYFKINYKIQNLKLSSKQLKYLFIFIFPEFFKTA